MEKMGVYRGSLLAKRAELQAVGLRDHLENLEESCVYLTINH